MAARGWVRKVAASGGEGCATRRSRQRDSRGVLRLDGVRIRVSSRARTAHAQCKHSAAAALSPQPSVMYPNLSSLFICGA
eukprot:scaffold139615_cov163-Phaeocystis_antarctica.AAC.1